MSGARACSLPGGALAALLGALVLLAMADTAQAQVRPGTAEIKRVTGRVEILRKGQTQWVPAAIGAKLAEGDEIRSFAGGSAELELPDTSSLLVAENTRLAVTKLVVDAQRQIRLGIFHLAIGKVRATIAQAAITLVRARQTNFAISTPTGVAAARGTDYAVFTDGRSIPDGGSMVVAVFRGAAIFANTTGTPVVVGVGGVSTQRGTAPPSAPVSITTLSPGTQATLRTTTANPETRDAPALLAPPGPRPATTQVVVLLVSATTKAAPAEAAAMVGGIVAAAGEAAAAVVTAAIQGGASAAAVIAAATAADPGLVGVIGAAAAAGPPASSPVETAVAAPPPTPASPPTVGTDVTTTAASP